MSVGMMSVGGFADASTGEHDASIGRETDSDIADSDITDPDITDPDIADPDITGSTIMPTA
jgi:hypothetical protein